MARFNRLTVSLVKDICHFAQNLEVVNKPLTPYQLGMFVERWLDSNKADIVQKPEEEKCVGHGGSSASS